MHTNILITSISRLCDQHGISINKMLQDVGLNKSLVDNLKKGSMPSIDKITKIADYFGVTVDYLLGKSDTPNPQTTAEPAIPEDSVIFHFNGEIGKKKLNKEQMAMIKAMLDAIPDTHLDN